MPLNIRSLIVELTPPALLRMGQKARHYVRHGFMLRRQPSAANVGAGYDDDKYARLIVADKLRARKLEQNDERGWYLILPLVVSQFIDEPLTVLDFGGGAATGLFCILDQVTGLDPSDLTYVLVETPAMCRAVREGIVPALPQLAVKIVEDIPSKLAGLLIVNIGSSIQYIPAYREVLARLAGLSPQLIIVAQTPMTDGPTSSWQQVHPYGQIAARMFNRSQFLAEMRSLGYACIFVINHNAGPQGEEPAFRSSMVFRQQPK